MIKNNIRKQQGAALAISLILLVTMTILGVATLNGTRMAEKVSSNAQQKAIVYETAESVIHAIANSNDFDDRLAVAHSTGFEPAPVPQNIETAAIADELDQTNALGTSVDVNAEGEIEYCVEKPMEGFELNDDVDTPADTGRHFDVRSVATIDNSRARAAHVLRIAIPALKSGRSGSCVTPGQ